MSSDRDRTWVESMPAAYARGLEDTVFAPFAVELARRAAVDGPRTVLEVAAGTGVVTRALVDALPGADVLATDLNAAMVDLGRSRVPQARWERAEAAQLPAEDGRVDLVCCGFGVMFFPDRVAGYREAHRVLAPGRRFAFTTWDDVTTHAFADALLAGLRAAFPDDPPTFVADVPHGYTDPDLIRADLAAAGFAEVRLDRVVLTGDGDPAVVAEGFCTGTPLRAQILERGDLAATVRSVGRAMTDILGPAPVTGSMAAYVVEAVRG